MRGIEEVDPARAGLGQVRSEALAEEVLHRGGAGGRQRLAAGADPGGQLGDALIEHLQAQAGGEETRHPLAERHAEEAARRHPDAEQQEPGGEPGARQTQAGVHQDEEEEERAAVDVELDPVLGAAQGQTARTHGAATDPEEDRAEHQQRRQRAVRPPPRVVRPDLREQGIEQQGQQAAGEAGGEGHEPVRALYPAAHVHPAEGERRLHGLRRFCSRSSNSSSEPMR